MMLIDTDIGQPFEPDLNIFMGPFNIYDRDELEDYLNKYDPNNKVDRKFLTNYIINKLSWISDMSYRHTWMVVNALEKTLKDKDHDLSIYFEDNSDNYFHLPGDWDEIQNPRGFFEEILKVAKEEWKDDLEKASKEDPSTW